MTSSEDDRDLIGLGISDFNDWRSRVKEKLAATGKDEEAEVTEAFAQQAYATISERCSALMQDPFLLGFEIVERNEKNTRLVGVFAFRLAEEILLAPVFFIHGKTKGQYLLYRKGANRFVPNTKDWISYLISQIQDQLGGEAEPRDARGARMNIDMRALASPTKRAAENTDAPVDIHSFWKEAKSQFQDFREPAPIFSSVLANHPELSKQAALYAEKNFEFAEAVVAGKCLETTPTIEKRASSEREYDFEVYSDFTENTPAPQLESLMKRGYAINDVRPEGATMEIIQDGNMGSEYSGVSPYGVTRLLCSDGQVRKVLYGKESDYLEYSKSPHQKEAIIFLEGPDEGKLISNRDFYHLDSTESDSHRNKEDIINSPVFCLGKNSEEFYADGYESEEDSVGMEIPEVGEKYLVWYSDKKQIATRPLKIKNVKKSEDGNVFHIIFSDVVEYNSRPTCEDSEHRAVLRRDIQESSHIQQGDLRVMYYGTNARFIKYKNEPVTHPYVKINDLWQTLMSGRKGSFMVKKANDQYLIHTSNGKEFSFYSEKEAATKLTQFGIRGETSMDLIDQARDGNRVSFGVYDEDPIEVFTRNFVKAGTSEQKESFLKEASARPFYENETDPEVQFVTQAFDEDLALPVDHWEDNTAKTQVQRNRREGPVRRYLDAKQHSTRNPTSHIPDEVILNMSNPGLQLAQLGEQMHLENVIDHGAVGALVNTFHAGPMVREYLGKQEEGLDYLGRILFLLFWKPNDFSELFGEDDLPQLENKLTGVFERYGDLILELKKSAAPKE